MLPQLFFLCIPTQLFNFDMLGLPGPDFFRMVIFAGSNRVQNLTARVGSGVGSKIFQVLPPLLSILAERTYPGSRVTPGNSPATQECPTNSFIRVAVAALPNEWPRRGLADQARQEFSPSSVLGWFPGLDSLRRRAWHTLWAHAPLLHWKKPKELKSHLHHHDPAGKCSNHRICRTSQPSEPWQAVLASACIYGVAFLPGRSSRFLLAVWLQCYTLARVRHKHAMLRVRSGGSPCWCLAHMDTCCTMIFLPCSLHPRSAFWALVLGHDNSQCWYPMITQCCWYAGNAGVLSSSPCDTLSRAVNRFRVLGSLSNQASLHAEAMLGLYITTVDTIPRAAEGNTFMVTRTDQSVLEANFP